MGFRGLGRALCAVLAIFAATAFAADTQYVSQKGSWILNKAETKIPAGGFVPVDTPTMVTLDDGKALKFVIYVMTSTGLQPSITFEGAYDGKPYAYGQDATRSFLHVSANSFRADTKANDGASSSEVVTFAAGNAKMRAEGKYMDAKGKTYDYVEVWDKLQ